MKTTFDVRDGKPILPRRFTGSQEACVARATLLQARDLQDSIHLRMQEVASQDGSARDQDEKAGSVRFDPPAANAGHPHNWGCSYQSDEATGKPTDFYEWAYPRQETDKLMFQDGPRNTHWLRSVVVETREGPCRVSESLLYDKRSGVMTFEMTQQSSLGA